MASTSVLRWRTSTSGVGAEAIAPNAIGQRRPGRLTLVITRLAKGGIFSRRMGIVSATMGLIAFALGYLLHPT